MKKEVIVTAKTIEQAVELGAAELKMKKENVTYSVIELPKKGFLGLGSTDAKVKVTGEMLPKDIAVGFLEKIIAHMNINAVPKVISETESEIKIDIIGENLGTLIGYHGEILDSMQYLTYLAVNKEDEEEGELSDKSDKLGNDKAERIDRSDKVSGIKISIDIENYRKKREETLQALAKKMAERVSKYGRSVTLEPMNAYERRIIHATIQDIDGVSTHSIGQDNDRKIVITKDMPIGGKPSFNSGARRPRPYYNSGSSGSFNRSNTERTTFGGNKFGDKNKQK
ncbi:MAG: protein jag [Oscillospiraceae bacterium]|nr:protein jag [Oscillospiraceae bacterium]